ncbi:MAG: nickel-type superoxide dismutase maturation protease [Candidatus Levybacteria bacterium]|nr:nickel-type superoxide dismutase maturation protease [Candidatus Levybacteria bacterium]
MLLSKIKVVGHSMEPTLKQNKIVIVSSIPYLFKKPTIGDIVVLKRQKYIIKRITAIKKEQVFVIGDNKKESTDSRNFGWIKKDSILGKVIHIG